MTPEDLVAHYAMEPIPREGGLFRQTWAGPDRPDGRPEGTAIVALLRRDDYSALHRLPTDEVWHFYLGDPLELLLLAPRRRLPHGRPRTGRARRPAPAVHRGGRHLDGRAGRRGRLLDVLRLHDGARIHLRGVRAR
ncbi:hypothetical protein GCM10020295_43230 [Streptomyces cinereospinus]